MKVELVRIGNSRGIRIPKALIEECGFGDTVEIRVERGRLVITRDRKAREGWDEAFRRAGSSADDELLLDGLPPNEFDLKEWKW